MHISPHKTILFSLFFSLFLLFLFVPSFAAYENTYVNTGNQQADILGVAQTQLGYAEGTSGYTKYGAAYNNPYGDWCAYFVSWCARNAGISTNIIPDFAGCTTAYNKTFPSIGAVSHSPSGYIPKKGDLIFFDWNYNDGYVYHVGIVTEDSNGSSVTYIDGNNTKKQRRYTYIFFKLFRNIRLCHTELRKHRNTPFCRTANSNALYRL